MCVCVVSGGWADGEDRKGLQLGLLEVGFLAFLLFDVLAANPYASFFRAPAPLARRFA